MGTLRGNKEIKVGGPNESLGTKMGEDRCDEFISYIEVDKALFILAQLAVPFAKASHERDVLRYWPGLGFFAGFGE